MLVEISNRQKLVIIIGVLLAMLLSALDQTIVATALPRIVQDLKGLEYLSWVTTAYLLTSTIVIPIAGKLSDFFGRKYVFLIGITIFLIGSLTSGLSQNIVQLIICRGFQGIGAGILTSIAFTIIGDLFVPAERGKWQGLFGGVFALASVIGPILGGWLTDHASWRWNFFINLPIGVIAVIVILLLMPNITGEVKKKAIDIAGIITLSIWMTALLLGLVWGGSQYAWNSLQIIGLLASAAIFLCIFLFVEHKAKEPLLPLDLFKNHIFTVSIIITFFISIGMFGAIIYIPLFAQNVLGVNATNSGTILTPLVLALVLTSIISGQLMSRTGRYKILAISGLGLSTIAMILFSTLTVSTTRNELLLFMVLLGLGLGFCMPIFNLAVQNAFDHSRLAVATASVQLFRNLGSTVGTAVMGSILNNVLGAKLQNIGSDPFLLALAKMKSQFPVQSLNLNSLEGLLSSAFQNKITAAIMRLPGYTGAPLLHAFQHFIFVLKVAIASSIAQIYFIGVFFMAAAFLTSFFLKEIPLRKSHKTESGMPESETDIVEEPAITI